MALASEEGPVPARHRAVSFVGAGLRHHEWAVEQWKRLSPPLLTCEPVLTEAAFLLKREGRDTDPLFALLERGVIRIALAVQEEQADLRALMHRYRNRPMSLADACLVRLSEIHRAGESLHPGFRLSDISATRESRDSGAYAGLKGGYVTSDRPASRSYTYRSDTVPRDSL